MILPRKNMECDLEKDVTEIILFQLLKRKKKSIFQRVLNIDKIL